MIQKENRKSMVMASGAPREGFTGTVRIFTLTDNGVFKSVKIGHVIQGLHRGSYFGYSLASCDVNADRSNDLIIGAPFYSTKQSPNVGAVYVYRLARQHDVFNFYFKKKFFFT